MADIVADINHHPQKPALVGLRNLSQRNWLATMPNGSHQTVQPNRSVRLALGTRINFGLFKGEVPMNDKARETLRAVLQRYGNGLLEDPKRCEAVLRDLCGDCRPEISSSIMALKLHVPQELGAAVSLPYEVVETRLVRRFVDEMPVTRVPGQQSRHGHRSSAVR